jgi:hypothetical protein
MPLMSVLTAIRRGQDRGEFNPGADPSLAAGVSSRR